MPVMHLQEWRIREVLGLAGFCGLLILVVALCIGNKRRKDRSVIDAWSHTEQGSPVHSEEVLDVNLPKTLLATSSNLASLGKPSHANSLTTNGRSSIGLPPTRRTASLIAPGSDGMPVRDVPRSQTLPVKSEDAYAAVKSLSQLLPDSSGNTTSGSSDGPYARVKSMVRSDEVAYLVTNLGEDSYEIVNGQIRRKQVGPEVSSVVPASEAGALAYESVSSDMQSRSRDSEPHHANAADADRICEASTKSDSDRNLQFVSLESSGGGTYYASVSKSPPAPAGPATYVKEDSGASGYYAAVADRQPVAVQSDAALSRVYEAVAGNSNAVANPDQRSREDKPTRESRNEKSSRHGIHSLFKKSSKQKADDRRTRPCDGEVERKTSNKKRKESSSASSLEKDDELASLQRARSLSVTAPPPPSVESLKQAVEHRRATRTLSNEHLNGFSSTESSPRVSPRDLTRPPAVSAFNTIATVEASRLPYQKRPASEKESSRSARSTTSDDVVDHQRRIPYAKRCFHESMSLPPLPPAPLLLRGVEIYEHIIDNEKPYATVDAHLKKSIQGNSIMANGEPIPIPIPADSPVKSERSLSQTSVGSVGAEALPDSSAIVDESIVISQGGPAVLSPGSLDTLPDYATVNLAKKEDERRKKDSYAAIVPKKQRGGTVILRVDKDESGVQANCDGSYASITDLGASRSEKSEGCTLTGTSCMDKCQTVNGAGDENRNSTGWRVVDYPVETNAYELVPGESLIQIPSMLCTSWKRHSSDDLKYEVIAK